MNPNLADFLPYILSGLTGVLGIIGGTLGARFWQKRWVAEIDKKLSYLNQNITNLVTKVEVSTVLHNKTDGALIQMQKALNESNKDIGAIDRKTSKLWGFLEGKFKSEITRLSDCKE